MTTTGSSTWSGLARVVIAAAVGGVVIGGALGLFGVGASGAEPGVMTLDAVPVYVCPGEGEVGTLYRGDRVLIMGQSDGWLAVRNVRGSGERVFVSAAFVTADADLSNLPVQDCENIGSLSVASSEIVTSTTAPSVETTTTMTVSDSTTTSSSSTTTSTTSSSTTTTAPPTTTTTTTLALPSVDNLSASPDPIWEQYSVGGDSCGQPPTSTIAASVSAAAGVQSVTMSWMSAHGNGSRPMSSGGGTYNATLGPFEAAGSENGGSDSVSITITLVDNQGRQATGQTTVTLRDCTFG